DVYGHLSQRIAPGETAGDLLDSLAASGAVLVENVVDALDAGTARAEPQSGDVTLAPKLGLADGRIDFDAHHNVVMSHIRGVTPEPGAFAEAGDSRVKVLRAGAGRADLGLAPGEVIAVDG